MMLHDIETMQVDQAQAEVNWGVGEGEIPSQIATHFAIISIQGRWTIQGKNMDLPH